MDQIDPDAIADPGAGAPLEEPATSAIPAPAAPQPPKPA
ncbi:thermonuclease family protein, partial [Mesorhizobium sp. M00.F.Ca.ET.149.01.1.1]